MNTVDEAVVLSEDLQDSLNRYDEIVDTISKLKSEKDVIEHTIMSLMKENEHGRGFNLIRKPRNR